MPFHTPLEFCHLVFSSLRSIPHVKPSTKPSSFSFLPSSMAQIHPFKQPIHHQFHNPSAINGDFSVNEEPIHRENGEFDEFSTINEELIHGENGEFDKFSVNGEPIHRENGEFDEFSTINDNLDLLIEVLKRLDGRSLTVAACVCRQWRSIVQNDSLWEHLCFRHVSPPPVGVRPVVTALGGYRRLYMVCVRPVLSRLKRRRIGGESEVVRRVWNRHEVELSLSLFSVEYFERLLVGGGRVAGDSTAAASLKFLCMPVNV